MDRQSTIKLLNETFNQNFELEKFVKFVKELFNKFTVTQKSWAVSKEYSDYIKSYQLLGSYKDTSKKTIEILVVKLKRASSRDRARTMQRNFVAKYLGNTQKDAALVAFYGDDPEDWRFSFVKMEYNLVKDKSGKVTPVKELTPAKRYSFLVGVNEPNHTCRSQFLKLVMEEEVNPSFSEIEQAFSIDNVTKEFFEKYKELFLRLKGSLEKVLKKDKNVQKEFEEKNISTVDFSKKLLGQIVFIYFLQKKGWLGVQKSPKEGFAKWGTGPKDFLRRLFDKEIVPYDNFFNEILEPLFYEALATERDDDYYSMFNCKIPFLNGGLFEPINDYDWAETDIVLDNSIFERIFSTFDRFNFTVKEDEPLEKEVAVDPEMLGKVFENLLEIKDRKSKGAFYTPREIVHYMCQQSLINYLETNTSISHKDIEKLIQMGDVALDHAIKAQEQKKKYHGKTFDIDESLIIPKDIENNYEQINKLLKKIKIVDPACGSGAFLIGMLNEIVKIRSILAIFSNKDQNIYDTKREIIENCLYGVDIESSAVDISKLRFWLSLVVDELDMKNIKPLPNLDHKIMCGNSLLEEFGGVKLFDEKLLGQVEKDYSFEIKQIDNEIADLYKEKGEIIRGKTNGKTVKEIDKEIRKLEKKKKKILSGPKDTFRNLTLDEVMQKRIKESKKKLSELKKLQKQFFNEQNRKLKKKLREDIDKIEWELIEETLKEQGNIEAMQKLEQYKKNKAKPFFLWKLYFAEVFQRENSGFDVVIGNPPYVDSENMVKNIPKLRNELTEKYETTKGNWDLYIPFFELSFIICRKQGILTFITPNKWLSIGYGKQLRKYFLNHIIQLCNCDEIRVFEAGNTPEISFIKKIDTESSIRIHSFTPGYLIKDKGNVPRLILALGNWGMVLSKHLQLLIKLLKNPKKVDNYCEVENPFTVSEAYELVKCLYDGNKIRKSNDLKLINTGTIDRYISLWGHKTTSYIKKKYRYPWIDARKFEKAFPRRYEQTTSTKIIITGIRYFECYFDSKGKYVAGKSTIIIRHMKNDNSMLSLLGILNSNVLSLFIKEAFSATGIGGGVNFTSPMVSSLPMPEIDKNSAKSISKLSNDINNITESDDYLNNRKKQAKVKRLEKEINKLVYKLYGLTPKEIKIVEDWN